jgi:hypothetical protein
MTETPLDKSINKFMTYALIIGGIGAIGYFYFKKKYQDKIKYII